MRKMLFQNEEDSCIKIYQYQKFLPHNFILKKQYFNFFFFNSSTDETGAQFCYISGRARELILAIKESI